MPALPVGLRNLAGAGVVAAIFASPLAMRAQEVDATSVPAHVSYVDGTATVERDGDTETVAVNAPVVAGDRLQTTSGRLEVLFPDGSVLDLDEYSSADVLAPTLVRLSAGRAILSVVGINAPSGAVRYRVDTPVASVRTDGPGEFRITVVADGSGDQTELAVMRGAATIATERGSMPLRAGERSMAVDDRTPSAPQTFNAARFDDFDRWYAERRAARVNPPSTTSAQYLPADLRTYGGTFDRYGSWQYSAPYGYVWYPSVAADWRPYYYGYWSSVPSYGWTWVGADVWSWPTHHYGRWGYGRGSWFWIPGRTWGTAWVSWASAPGYVSWCPLGFDGRPVFGLSVGVVSPWSGWVVVPRTSFGVRSFYASRHSIQAQRLPRSTPFTVESRAPAPAPRGARANATNASSPTGVAVPRFPTRSPDSFGSGNGRRTGHGESRGDVSRETPAVGPGTNNNGVGSAREFRRPLPGEFRTPSVDRSAPANPTSGPPPRAVSRTREAERPGSGSGAPPVFRTPDGEGSGNRRSPQPRVPANTPAPQAVPRYSPPPGEMRLPAPPSAETSRYRRSPQPTAPANTPAPQAAPRYAPPTREMRQPAPSSAPAAAQPTRPQYASPGESSSPRTYERSPQAERPPQAQRSPSGSGGEAGRAPHGDRPSGGGSDSRAVPRGEGSHQGRQR